MQTILGVDWGSTKANSDESVRTWAWWVNPPGEVHVIAFTRRPDYSPPDMAASLDALYKCIRCPSHMATKGT